MITGNQFRGLHHALLTAFPTFSRLSQFVLFSLNIRLEEITPISNMSDIVYSLMQWADAHGRLEELLREAVRENPGNPYLKQASAELIVGLKVVEAREAAEALADLLLEAPASFHIEQITLRNFRSFANREFRFQRQFNILIGDNATGKTAVLDALALVAGSWFVGIRGARLSLPLIHPDDVRLVGRRIGEEFTFERQTPVEVAATGSLYGEQVEWRRFLYDNPEGVTPPDLAAIESRSAAIVRLVRAGYEISLPLIAYYGAGRLWLQKDETETEEASFGQDNLSRLEGYRGGVGGRISPDELTQWLERQDRITYQQGHPNELYLIVRQAMREMLEGAREVRYDNQRLAVVVEFEDGSLCPFAQLSDGQRNILALAGDIAMRMARLNPHLGWQVLAETPGIVLIDELDLHLHPTWQRHVVEDLRSLFPKVQFIATTHSPFIVQTLRPGELLPLDAQPVPEVANLGIEDIARGLMGVEHPEVSPRYREMVEVAKEYLRTVAEAAGSTGPELQAVKARLAEKIAPYADNPAFQAFLEMRRVAQLGE